MRDVDRTVEVEDHVNQTRVEQQGEREREGGGRSRESESESESERVHTRVALGLGPWHQSNQHQRLQEDLMEHRQMERKGLSHT